MSREKREKTNLLAQNNKSTQATESARSNAPNGALVDTAKSGSRALLTVCLMGLVASFVPNPCQAQGFTITSVAGCDNCGFQANWGDGGPATNSTIGFGVMGVTKDYAGNLFIADTGHNVIRKIATTGIITTFAGNGNGTFSGDGGPALLAQLSSPVSVAVDAAGSVYVSDKGNNRIRKITPDGKINTFAGGGHGCGGQTNSVGDGCPATSAILNLTGITAEIKLDAAGNLFIGDYSNGRVRKVSTNGIITTVAGSGQCCTVGDGGPATNAYLTGPGSVALDVSGNIYICCGDSQTVRKVSTNGTITRVAGNGGSDFSGDGGPALAAGLGFSGSVAVDNFGNLYIADWLNNRIRQVTLDGKINTIAGGGKGCGGQTNLIGDGCPATSAQLSMPEGMEVEADGSIYFADSANSRIRLLKPNIPISLPSIKTGGVVTASAFGQFSSVAPSSWIEIYGSGLATGSRSWTGADFSGVNAPTSLDGTKVTIGGQAAFIDYISPGQVNAQVPSNVGTGPMQMTITSSGVTSAAYIVTVNLSQPGLLAPLSFNVNGRQYAVALFPDGVTYVLPPGALSGVPSRRAKPGDTISFYGVGFGPVTPSIPAGQIVQQSNTLALPLQVLFGQSQATLSYSGLAPTAVGLYQFNVVVPNVADSDAIPLNFILGGVSGTQTLYIAVQN
jgi:uncharacterized protein (TIGR03437 family)